MSWSETLYVQLPDAAAVVALAAQLGIESLPDDSLSTGNHHFALQAIAPAPWETPPVLDDEGEVITPGVRMPGLWFMGRINDAWAGAAQAMAALQAAGVLRELVDPPVVFA